MGRIDFRIAILLTGIYPLAALASPVQEHRCTLADLYKQGTLRLVPEIVLDDTSLPAEAVLEVP